MNEPNPNKTEKPLSMEEAMKQAANDPLFIADIEEVMEDFKHVDREWFGEDEDS